MADVRILEAAIDDILEYGICGYKNVKTPGFAEKVKWLEKRFKEGMKVMIVHSEKGGTQGMIEYIPSEYCWRPVDAKGYMFIHCLFVGFKKEYKNQGFASALIDICEADAKKLKMKGVAIVTRKGSFMIGNEIFLKRGYEIAGTAPSDFELLVKRFNKKTSFPKFLVEENLNSSKYKNGLIIIRSDQCPYSVKNVNEIIETAENRFNIKPKIVNLKNHNEAQKSPCPFGTFCILFDGKVISEHPISNTRFYNIMSKLQ